MIKQKELLFVLISSTILTFIWIGSTLYHAHVTSTIEEPLTTLILPISARFNTQAIQKITNRAETVPTYNLSGVKVPSPTSTPTESSSLPTDEPSTTPTAVTPTATTPTPTQPTLPEALEDEEEL